MPVETHLHHAREQVDAERSLAAAKADGLATFGERLEGISTDEHSREA